MQKKLLGIAVAAALAAPPAAFAQLGTGVQLYGKLDFSANNFRYEGDPTGADVSKGELYSSISHFGVRGRESLGGGLHAWFQVEMGVTPFRPEPNGGAGVGNSLPGGRQTGLGLDSSWGTIMAGNWDSPYKRASLESWSLATYGLISAYGIIMNNGDSTGTEPSPFCSNNNAGTQICGNGVMAEGSPTAFGRRLSNSVQYWSPNLGGFQAKVATQMTSQESPSGTVGAVDPSLWSFSLGWSGGPFKVIAAYEQHEDFTAVNAKDTAWQIGGRWTTGPFAVALGMEQLEYEATAAAGPGTGFERKNFVVNTTYNMGSGQLFAGYSWTPGNDSCGATLAAAATAAGSDCESISKADILALGYAHHLSKRTSAYVQFVNVDNTAAGTAAAPAGTAYNFIAAPPGNAAGGTGGILVGTDIRVIGVGVRHFF